MKPLRTTTRHILGLGVTDSTRTPWAALPAGARFGNARYRSLTTPPSVSRGTIVRLVAPAMNGMNQQFMSARLRRSDPTVRTLISITARLNATIDVPLASCRTGRWHHRFKLYQVGCHDGDHVGWCGQVGSRPLDKREFCRITAARSADWTADRLRTAAQQRQPLTSKPRTVASGGIG